jgi:RND family efflux transporter MFP subunit
MDDISQQPTQRNQWAVGIIILILIAAAIIWIVYIFIKPKPEQIKKASPVYVKVISPQQANWSLPYITFGTIDSQAAIQVAAETPGRLILVNYQHPQYVKKGQLLFKIYNKASAGALASAIANLKYAKQDLHRKRILQRQGAISKDDLDIAINAYKSDFGAVKTARANVSLGIIRARDSGYIGINDPNVGDYVSAGEMLAQISVLNQMEVKISLPAIYLPDLHVGQKIMFTSPMIPDKKVVATLKSINSYVDTDTRQINIEADFKNTNPQYLPGQFVNATIYLGKKKPVFVVPETALVYDLGGVNVFTIVNGKARFVPVTVYQRRDSEVGIEGNLSTSDKIISLGTLKVSNGTQVITTIPTKST